MLAVAYVIGSYLQQISGILATPGYHHHLTSFIRHIGLAQSWLLVALVATTLF